MKINEPKFWVDKKVFLTGATGFIGKHLVNRLRALGAEVRVFVHTTPSVEKQIVGNLIEYADTIELRKFLQTYLPDVVFHLAAQPLINDAEKLLLTTLDTNIRGTYNLLFACSGVKSIQSIVHISTDKVYGNLDIITEKEIPNGVEHPYNASKLSADIIAQMFANTFDLPLVIIRNGNIYGDGDLHWERIVPRTFKQVLSGKSPVIRGDGTAMRDYIHVSEIVAGFINAATYNWAKTGVSILRLGSNKSYPVSEVIDQILKLTKRIDLSPVYETVLRGEIPNQHIVDTVSREAIGWYPEIDLERGLELTAPYYLEKCRD
jgi:CDP-glucose 4,6-dehydratase